VLRLASEADFPVIRELIVDGATSGGFDPQLAQPSEESAEFFARLRHVIRKRIWLRPDLSTHMLWAIPACICVFEDPVWGLGPLGFVALRGAGRIGYELWLAAIELAYRKKGVGKQMIGEVLGTPIGQQVVVVQCDRRAEGARRMASILGHSGFECVREAMQSQWLARSTLPTAVKDRIKSIPFSGPA
jgi:GNAT superfamily N-acetyltransferase